MKNTIFVFVLFYKRLFLMRRRSLLIKICQQVKLEISIAASPSLIKSDVSVRVSLSNETTEFPAQPTAVSDLPV